jgi:hypothetical protein
MLRITYNKEEKIPCKRHEGIWGGGGGGEKNLKGLLKTVKVVYDK